MGDDLSPDTPASTDGMGLHVCCAPCLARTRAALAQGGETYPIVAKIFFYNPNIHLLLEFRRRLKALCIYLERDRLSAGIDDRYGLRAYLDFMYGEGGLPANRRDRCYKCYRHRLARTAWQCRAEGLGRFSTTLLASREQDLDIVALAGAEAAKSAGLEFVAGRFGGYEADARLLRGIYKQQYCGCLFSEEERFAPTNKHLYRPGDAAASVDEDE